MPHEDEVTVETLSTPPTRIQPAPLLRRVTAGITDSLIVILLWLTLTGKWTSLSQMSTASGVASTEPLAWVDLGIVTLVYYILFEWLFASSVGKFMLKLRVVGKDGEPCPVAASIKRNVLRFVDWLPFLYVVGMIAVLFTTDNELVIW
jgi:uncharacterized RDD family membrane protein YckC